MCGIDPLVGAMVIGLSVGFFTLLSLNFANTYKRKKAERLSQNE